MARNKKKDQKKPKAKQSRKPAFKRVAVAKSRDNELAGESKKGRAAIIRKAGNVDSKLENLDKPKLMKARKPVLRISDPTILLKHDFERLAPSKSAVPHGYIFVPKGDVYITRQWFETALESALFLTFPSRLRTAAADRILHVVYSEKTNQQLGLRCPANIFSEVSAKAQETAESRRQAVERKDEKDIDAARKVMKQLFPAMRLSVAKKILDHGFEKRSGRVGRTGTLGLEEKVGLAVSAYVRHTFTPYDELLQNAKKKTSGFVDREPIRKAVKPKMDKVLEKWRIGAKSASKEALKFKKALQKADRSKRTASASTESEPKKRRISFARAVKRMNPNRAQTDSPPEM